VTEHHADGVAVEDRREVKAGSCDLTTGESLPGNWTHGDHVNAVAGSGDPTDIQAAAHSDCGKPMVAVGHGGPPVHALDYMAASEAHAASIRMISVRTRRAAEPPLHERYLTTNVEKPVWFALPRSRASRGYTHVRHTIGVSGSAKRARSLSPTARTLL
jgi:hypothetical protein